MAFERPYTVAVRYKWLVRSVKKAQGGLKVCRRRYRKQPREHGHVGALKNHPTRSLVCGFF